MTLLDFIVDSVLRTQSDVLRFQEEVPSLEHACMVDIGRMKEDLSELASGLELVRAQIEVNKDTNIKKDQFVTVMQQFEVTATYELNHLRDKFEKMSTAIESAAEYFAEDPQQLANDPALFFRLLRDFSKQLLDSEKRYRERKKQLERERERQLKKERMKEELEEQAKAAGMEQEGDVHNQLHEHSNSNGSHVNESRVGISMSPIEGDGNSVSIDALHRRMRNGSLFKRRRDSRGRPELPSENTLRKHYWHVRQASQSNE